MQYVYQQFGNATVFFALAAYNAGPGRVRTLPGNSAGRIDAVAFVESILSKRGYVKTLLAYDATIATLYGAERGLNDDLSGSDGNNADGLCYHTV